MWLFLLSVLGVAVALLGSGLVEAQRAFLTRGIPEGYPPVIAHGGARLGVNVYLDQYDEIALTDTLADIRATGIDTIKQTFYYPGDQAYNWEHSDRLVAAAVAQGLDLVALLDGNPSIGFAPPADPADFAAWTGAFAARYEDAITYYIIWDEPNLTTHWGGGVPNPAEYGALLGSAAQAIRRADPDAVIVAAPLAPTVEMGPDNLSETLFLQGLYDAGAGAAFDIVAGKPYGFATGPDDRDVEAQQLNFSRIILLREIMEANGDSEKAVWAGNWGWNSLPADWAGPASIWGEATETEQAEFLIAGWERARREWPWMGHMFIENWEPDAPEHDPRWGFSIAGRPAESALARSYESESTHAFPGFHLAEPDPPQQIYSGTWRFSPTFGADLAHTGDTATFQFWGTDVGLRVRKADYRARLYVAIDGEPARALPHDGQGAALVLTSETAAQDALQTVPVAEGLEPGPHTLQVTAWRGWEAWPLNGYKVAYHPPPGPLRVAQGALLALLVVASASAVYHLVRTPWLSLDSRLRHAAQRLQEQVSLLLTALAGAIVAVSGWLTWGGDAAGVYRRLGDSGQLALTAAAALVFYVTPAFLLYILALLTLFVLIYLRPAWGLALVAFSFPLYVLPKPALGYLFSPVEVFLLVTVAATVARELMEWARRRATAGGSALRRNTWRLWWRQRWRETGKADLAVLAFVGVATLSLLFTERLDVASNEWRVVILEPALFYLLFRVRRPADKEVWAIVDLFVLGGLVIALYGLYTYARGENVITVEDGLWRLRSIFGSPNNVALYLGRILPLLLAMMLMGQAHGRRRWAYVLLAFPVALALVLSFSKGAFFLGIPAALLVLFLFWRRAAGGRLWPWLLGLAGAVLVGLVVVLTVPGLSDRLSIQGTTTFARVNLWRSSLMMFQDHPIIGVGLDNFLYEYRSRYILDAAWREPDLNHPHNLILDFATRLGVLGLVAGLWLFGAWAYNLYRLTGQVLRAGADKRWLPLAGGLAAAFAQTVAHGLVDHSFFLVDLAFIFFFYLALTLWLREAADT